MSKSPAYQRYPKDYMSDGNVLRMTFEQRGIYDWLLDSCWLEDGIPADVGELALICSLPARRMASAWERIAKCFVPHPSKAGWLTNRRLEEERAKQGEFSEAMSEAGRKGAAKRWAGHKPGYSQATPEPMASDSFAVCSLPLQSALQEPEVKSTVGSPKKKRRAIPTYTPGFLEVWAAHKEGGKAEAFEEYKFATEGGVEHAVILWGIRAYVKAKVKPGFDGVALFRWIRDRRWEAYEASTKQPTPGPTIYREPEYTAEERERSRQIIRELGVTLRPMPGASA